MKLNRAWIGGAFAMTLSLCAVHEANADDGANPAHSCSLETRRHNAALGVTVFEQVLGQGRIAENEHIYHPEFVAHAGDRDVGRSEDRAATEGWRAAIPDLRVTVVRLAADCDLVAVHFEASGTNTGEGGGLPATGRHARSQGITIFGVRDGKVAEEWTVFDQYGMLRQLGLLGK